MPIKYVPFIPEPVEGQAVLGNFNRVLKYKGADDVSMTLQRGMPLYEMGETGNRGRKAGRQYDYPWRMCFRLCLSEEQGVQVDLVYIDPPFASGADYARKFISAVIPRLQRPLHKLEKELDIDELKAFEEKMYGDVWDKEKYLNWMYENLMAIKSVMSETASIYVHLDWHICHYVKILWMRYLASKISETRSYGHILEALPPERFFKKHDVIYRYAISEELTYNPVYEEYSETTIKRYDKVDEEGRRYKITYF